ncbi:MAG TPA: serpin family protein, partial [Allocoleopsis sp.]
ASLYAGLLNYSTSANSLQSPNNNHHQPSDIQTKQIEKKRPIPLNILVRNNNQFAFNLYNNIPKKPEENVFFSPYSISTSLAMTYAGAQGETANQMAKVLRFPPEKEIIHQGFYQLNNNLKEQQKELEYKFIQANGMWGQKGDKFLKSFTQTLSNSYEANITEIDFKNSDNARTKINTWIKDKTQKKITEIIPQGMLNEKTKLVLTNAVYFQANWAIEFLPEKTQKAPFKISNKKQVEVSMMHSKPTEFGYSKREDLEIIELPYKGGEMSMIILLPNKVNGLGELESSLNQQNLQNWLKNLSYGELIEVKIPKFKIEQGTDLKKVLTTMGMTLAFDPNKANFSGISDSKNLFLSAIVHKAFVNVNEIGTEASASTAVIAGLRGRANTIVNIDHPFIFLILDKQSQSILFLGRVINPIISNQ